MTLSRLRSVYADILAQDSGAYQRHASQMVAQIDAGVLPDTAPLPIAVWRFGDNQPIVLLALGRTVSEYSIRLKSQFNATL